MIKIQSIYDPIERECTEYATNYIQTFTSLYKKPIEELNYYRNRWNDLLIIQPPYRNNAGKLQYNDLSILSKANNVDIRYEFASLKVNGTLSGKALTHSLEAHNIPEQLLILVLIGRGYDDMVNYTLRPKIKEYKLRVSIIRTIEEYKRHIDNLFLHR